jgi:hypothetical protein
MIGPMIPGHLILSPTGILTSRYRETKRNQKMTTTNERETLAQFPPTQLMAENATAGRIAMDQEHRTVGYHPFPGLRWPLYELICFLSSAIGPLFVAPDGVTSNPKATAVMMFLSGPRPVERRA